MSIRPLSKVLQKKAEIELNEVPSRIPEDLKHIKEWLEKQPHLKGRTDDQWLMSFLRGCKYSLERTKEKLDLYYTMKTLAPELFSGKDPFLPEIQAILKQGVRLPLPTSDPDGPTLILLRFGRAKPETILNVIKAIAMGSDIGIAEDDNYVISGQHLLIDFRDVTYKHILQFTPNLVKKMTICFQNAYPTRPKGIHYLNAPPIFDAVYKVFRPLLSEKLKNRIGFYTDKNLHTLYDIFPRASLPKEYGGEAVSVDILTAEHKKKVESYQEWFREDVAFYSDETKRPGKPKTSEELFGVYGSFRKIDVD